MSKYKIDTLRKKILKRCIKCGNLIELQEFHQSKKSRDGKGSWCKECKANYQRNEYRKEHALNQHKYKARKKGVLDNLTYADWEKTLQFFDYKCAYCGSSLDEKEMQFEHIIPVVDGGETMLGNIVPVCSKCNSSKGKKKVLKWLLQEEFYDRDIEQKVLSMLRLRDNQLNLKRDKVFNHLFLDTLIRMEENKKFL